MLTQPVLAADMSPYVKAAPPQVKVHATDWSGAYVGAFGGLGVSTGNAAIHDYSGALIPLDVENNLFPHRIGQNGIGGMIGAGAGFNVQSGSFVGGIEADIAYARISATDSYSRVDYIPGSPFQGVSTNTGYSTDFGTLGTLRARGGFLWGDTLIFGTAGLAGGQVGNRFDLALPEIGYRSPVWSESGVRMGYAVGGGLEHRLTNNLTLKFDALYVNLADRVVHGADPAAFPGEGLSYRFSNDMFVSRLGVSARF